MPILSLDPKSHVPITLRQSVVKQCFEQYCRIYESRDDSADVASRLSLEAELDLFKKSNSKQVYRSTAVNVVHKLKKTCSTTILSEKSLQPPSKKTQEKSCRITIFVQ
jgi:hypothetical protein